MIKFIIFYTIGGVVLLNVGLSFWYVCGLVILGFILFTGGVSLFRDYIFISRGLALDTAGLFLIELSLWVCVLIYRARWGAYFGSTRGYFYLFIYFLTVALLITFRVRNFLSFYFFFEASLIPTLFIIIGWGYQPERIQAGVYFLFYTLFASLPLLIIIIINFWCGGVEIFFQINFSSISARGLIGFIFIVLAFLVKMPIFFTHLWLPKAHVEAPVAGSMILAGVLLKLGGYGLYRVFLITGASLCGYGGYLFGLRILGMLYVGFICLRLGDMKALVAYSSVAHIGLVICGVCSYYVWGFDGALLIIIAHGVCSSGLFCAVNYYYERSGSRGFYLNKGLILIIPIISLIFFLLCGANIAAPPTLNLLSEIFLMGRMMKFDKLILLFFPVGSYLGAVFTLFLFSYSQHGKRVESGYGVYLFNYRELHLIGLHLIPVNVLVIKGDYIGFMQYLRSLMLKFKIVGFKMGIPLK